MDEENDCDELGVEVNRKDENIEEFEDHIYEDGVDALSDGDGEDNNSERWIDVKDLKNMSLDELKTVSTENGRGDGDRRLDVPITKVVIRRLPPLITVDDYLQELTEVPTYSYIRLVPPNEDLPSRIGRRSSIYINFNAEQEAFWFKEKYNNMKFFDERGNSYIACVDFSFIQDIAQDSSEEAQQGTLEESDMYQTFLKAYEEEPWSFTMNRPDNIPTPEAMLDEILNKKVLEPDTTPLLNFLRERSQKKEADRKDREQRRKERDIAKRRQKEEVIKRRQKEKEEAASKRKHKEKEEVTKRKPAEDTKDSEKESQRDRRKERDRERQRERDRERRLRREREKLDREQTNTSSDKSGLVKESIKQKTEKDMKQKSFSGIVTYSRSGNPTRWSENSGPRKTDKGLQDDHKRSQEHLDDTKPSLSSDKLFVQKSSGDATSSDSKAKDLKKSAFGKPFPTKAEGNHTVEVDKGNKVVESGESSSKIKSSDGGPDRHKRETDGTIKKRIVKRVIKIKKTKENGLTENADEVSGSQQSLPPESKPKKIVRVIRKSSKVEDGSSGINTKQEDTASKKFDSDTKADTKDDNDKERKIKKGRPEIQIYRPGSLRGGSKPTSSGDKERKSDNNL